MTKSKYNELFEFLVDQFARIDERFDGVDARIDKIEDRLGKVEHTMHYLLKESREMRIELTVGAHRSHRMEDWIIRAAKKINLPYQT